MKHKKALFAALLLSAACMVGHGKVQLPFAIGNGMIIQQNTNALLWGKTQAGRTVQVRPSWSEKTYTTQADKSGHFELRVATPAAGFTPLSITFDDGEPLTISDVLAGDVWICGGQSNMQMPVIGFAHCPVEGYNDAVVGAGATANAIRYMFVTMKASNRPIEGEGSQWLRTDAEHVPWCSAVGYYFARELTRALNIPIGLVLANKGGTAIQCWLNDTTLRSLVPDVDLSDKALNARSESYRETAWYNGTFYPIHRYTCRGILFYQGCTNCDNDDVYRRRYADFQVALARQWRAGFGQGDIPFYFVQLAPFGTDKADLPRAYVREQQFKAMQAIPNSGLVCTTDLVYPWERRQIHPSQKRQVGQRLAYLALAKTYGFKRLYAESARLKNFTISNDTVHVFLDCDYRALVPSNLEGFELAGADRTFYPARACASEDYYTRDGIVLTCPEVKKPVAVRYNYHDYPTGVAHNAGGLPLFPFRTDNW